MHVKVVPALKVIARAILAEAVWRGCDLTLRLQMDLTYWPLATDKYGTIKCVVRENHTAWRYLDI
jgi:hypothetical protein